MRLVVCLLATATASARADVAVPASPVLPRVLTLDDALRTFRGSGLDLLIADAAAQSAEGQVLASGAVPNPQLSLSVGNAFTFSDSAASQSNCLANGASCSPWTNTIGISDSAAIEDSLSGKRDLRVRVARNALAAAKLSRRDAERTITYQVKVAYAQVAQAQLAFKFAKDVVETNVETLKKFRDLTRLGARGEADLERIEVQKLESDNALDQAEESLRNAKVALAFLLGVRGPVPDYEVDTHVLDYRPPKALETPDEIALLRAAFEHRPDLLALAYSKQSAEAQIELVRRQRFPDVTLGLSYSWGGFGGFSTNGPIQGQTLAVQLSLPIPVFYQLSGEARQARAQYDTDALQEAKATAQVASEIESGLATLAATRKLVERMEGPRREGGGLLESAHGAYIHTAQTFYGGSGTLTDLLDAYRTWIATQNEYYSDLAGYWTAVYELEQAVGRDLR
ncbi:MAG TPA: TolC family protein [Kofleriaceae bacterium]|nr:TolC family protein [Kofleriaceae bacterium]